MKRKNPTNDTNDRSDNSILEGGAGETDFVFEPTQNPQMGFTVSGVGVNPQMNSTVRVFGKSPNFSSTSVFGDPTSPFGDPPNVFRDPPSAFGDHPSAFGSPPSAFGSPFILSSFNKHSENVSIKKDHSPKKNETDGDNLNKPIDKKIYEEITFDFEFQKNAITDLCIESRDGRQFYISKGDLYYTSPVFKEALNKPEENGMLTLTIDYNSKDIYIWLKTFCYTENDNDILKPIEITQDILHIVIPIYHQYNMENMLKKCHILILKATWLDSRIVKIIFETDGFKDKYNDKVLNLILKGKIFGDYTNYIPNHLLLKEFININQTINDVRVSINKWILSSSISKLQKSRLLTELKKCTKLNL